MSGKKICRKRATGKSRISRIAECFKNCLNKGKYPDILQWVDYKKKIFFIIYKNKKSPEWTPDCLAFFKECDNTFSSKCDKYKKEANSEQACKIRCRSNLNKLVASKKVKFLREKRIDKCTRKMFYRFLDKPEEQGETSCSFINDCIPSEPISGKESQNLSASDVNDPIKDFLMPANNANIHIESEILLANDGIIPIEDVIPSTNDAINPIEEVIMSANDGIIPFEDVINWQDLGNIAYGNENVDLKFAGCDSLYDGINAEKKYAELQNCFLEDASTMKEDFSDTFQQDDSYNIMWNEKFVLDINYVENHEEFQKFLSFESFVNERV